MKLSPHSQEVVESDLPGAGVNSYLNLFVVSIFTGTCSLFRGSGVLWYGTLASVQTDMTSSSCAALKLQLINSSVSECSFNQ